MIHTQLHQKEMPRKIKTDSRGTDILEGSTVSYNRSGRIMIGTIRKYIKCDWFRPRPNTVDKWWWFLKFSLKVEGEDGQITYIKDPNNFVIIEPKQLPLTVEGDLFKFDQPDANNYIIPKNAINSKDFENMKIRGEILDYEINDNGVKVIKKVNLKSISF